MNLHVAIIGYVWPEPKSSAAGQNMLSIIHSCQAAGYQVSFFTAATDSAHKVDLAAIGVTSYDIALNCSSFNTRIAELNPDIVIFDRYMTEEQFSWRVKEACPHALRVLNTEDLHSLRQARHEAVKSNGDAMTANLNNELAQREIAAMLRSDITLVISQYEMALLKDFYRVPASQLYYHPLVTGAIVRNTPSFEARAHFVHIGNFRHAPNWDAVLQLKQHIWPEIRRALPQAQLHIYGAYPPKKATQLHNEKQGFLVKGWADSVEEVMVNARVLIAPLRFGAGIKGKLLDAMRCATPSITTWIGAEGIVDDNLHNVWPGAICDDNLNDPDTIDDYVRHAVALYTQKSCWQEASQKTASCLDQFDQHKPQVDLGTHLKQLTTILAQHRQGLFMQGLVWHHTLNATKYMSQWIEAKNRTPLPNEEHHSAK
ncbi:glycosyltransferase family 4 protein [Alteromonas sp. D210916BOD_24]|uniref:glycosyltransferase n=1 Tax=Alteromonas sp. D210916BOD_24 TaxID=3157618 RepID=UPI00399CF42E